MIPFLGGIPRQNGDGTPPPAGDLDLVLAGLTLSWREEFDQATLNAGRWNILAEPGQNQASPLGPTLEFPDHWGAHTHDPELVTLQGSVLRLGWGVTGGAWRTGGITSASQYGAASSAKLASTYGVTRARVRVPVTAGNSWGGVWQMPVANAYGAWPASGEIDGIEWTQQTDLNAADRHIGYSNVITAAGNNSRPTSSLVDPSFDILDGRFHEWAWYRRLVGSDVVITFYVDGRQYGDVTLTGSAAAPFKEPFYFLATAQLGWWGAGLPPDETLASQYMEVDWIEQWVATSQPAGSKPTEAPVLQAKGLSLIWQDRLGETDAPTDDRDFFQTTTGGRVHEDPASDDYPSDPKRRLSFVSYDGKPCLKVTYTAGAHGWIQYRAQYLPQRYREFGLCVDVKYPAGYNLRSTTNKNIYGKTLFGLAIGHPDYNKIGVPTSRSWAGEVTWPEDQWGAACGINCKYNLSYPDSVEYGWYPHVIGAYVNGADKFRLDKYSNVYNIPGYTDPGVYRVPIGDWHRLELYGKVDTNRRDGVLEMWVDGVLRKALYNLDLGGWVGNRGLARNVVGGHGYAGDNSQSAGTGQLVGSSGGGWRFSGVFIREMIGGWTASPDLIPLYGGSYYAYNWRVYGKV